MKNIGFFLSENFQFLEVKFSIYLNRRVFVMVTILCIFANIKAFFLATYTCTLRLSCFFVRTTKMKMTTTYPFERALSQQSIVSFIVSYGAGFPLPVVFHFVVLTNTRIGSENGA